MDSKWCKRLCKQINKEYYKTKQNLIIHPWEMLENSENDCSFDVHIANTDIFLFTVQNYNAFWDLDLYAHTYFKDQRSLISRKWDGVAASYAAGYFDRTFTLPTFKAITKEDLIKCTDYFCHKVLDNWHIWNVKFNDKRKRK